MLPCLVGLGLLGGGATATAVTGEWGWLVLGLATAPIAGIAQITVNEVALAKRRRRHRLEIVPTASRTERGTTVLGLTARF